MTRKQKIFLALALTLPELGLLALHVIQSRRFEKVLTNKSATFVGSVLAQNPDPAKQSPLAGVTVTASTDADAVSTKSDPSGFFNLTLKLGAAANEPVILTFEYPNYQQVQISATMPPNQLYIARMQPLSTEQSKPNTAVNPAKVVELKNIQVRYSFKDESTVGVGSLAKQFSAPNSGNVPCIGHSPCSPDGLWKATRTDLTLDAEAGNEFGNVRVSCIAGPCAFTKIEPNHFEQAQRRISISVLNWSDTADFLIEADISRTMVTDSVRISYPFIVGETMNFALPPSSEGPSVEADMDGQYIVFPLGPSLVLSWGACSVELSPNGDKQYRCQSKPGYRLAG